MIEKSRWNVLKRDGLGTIWLSADRTTIVRKCSDSVTGSRWLARRLARREHRALEHLAQTAGVPRALWQDRDNFARSFLIGKPMYQAKFQAAGYFKNAAKLLRKLHARGVAHNDLAKEANWICGSENSAGIVDYQLAWISTRRSRLFRMLAREDLRHLLKHKRHYAEHLLTDREKRILATPGWLTIGWRNGFKPIYLFFTRRILGWENRTGPQERIW